MKRFVLSVFAAFVLIALFGCVSALAQETSDGFTYTVNNNTARITGCSLTGDVVIPASIDGYTVTSLDRELFFGRYGVTSVSIPATVTCFGSDASDNMWDYVFSYCRSLREIVVDSGNPVFCSVDGVLYSKDMTILYNYPCAREGRAYHVPAKTKHLCCTSFAANKNLKSLHLDGLNTIWYTYTFYNSGALTLYYLPGGQTASRAQQFISSGMYHENEDIWNSYCSLSELPENAARLPQGLYTIQEEAFTGAPFEYVIVPDGCASVESRAFADCGQLRYVSVPENTSVAEDVFEGCGDVKTIWR